MVKVVPRGTSATADAYLTPCIKQYIKGFVSGFDDGFEKGTTQLQFMQSDGGLVPVSNFSGFKAILSGPAGGVVGYALTTFDKQSKVPVIGFDMGGTSTDVSRFDGHYEHVFETTTAGVTIQAPQLDINTVAAGGGSMLFFKNGMFVVGPEVSRKTSVLDGLLLIVYCCRVLVLILVLLVTERAVHSPFQMPTCISVVFCQTTFPRFLGPTKTSLWTGMLCRKSSRSLQTPSMPRLASTSPWMRLCMASSR